MMNEVAQRNVWEAERTAHIETKKAGRLQKFGPKREILLQALKVKRDPEAAKKRNAAWRKNNPDYFKNYRAKNRKKVLAANRRWYRHNIDVEREKNRIHALGRKDRYITDKGFAVECRLRSRVTEVIRLAGAKRYWKIKHIVGCEIQGLMKHLESQFQPDMGEPLRLAHRPQAPLRLLRSHGSRPTTPVLPLHQSAAAVESGQPCQREEIP
jgi:hypothetical protein